MQIQLYRSLPNISKFDFRYFLSTDVKFIYSFENGSRIYDRVRATLV